MGVQLDEEEAWAFLGAAHTAIVTTNRADGWPMALPAWLVVEGRRILVRKQLESATVRRLARDPRVCVTVESGVAWRDLKAVVVLGEAEVITDAASVARVEDLLAVKYGNHRRPASAVPAVERHYNRRMAVVRITPTQPFVSWDNRKVRPSPGPAEVE